MFEVLCLKDFQQFCHWIFPCCVAIDECSELLLLNFCHSVLVNLCITELELGTPDFMEFALKG